jgi:hypothetical protein
MRKVRLVCESSRKPAEESRFLRRSYSLDAFEQAPDRGLAVETPATSRNNKRSPGFFSGYLPNKTVKSVREESESEDDLTGARFARAVSGAPKEGKTVDFLAILNEAAGIVGASYPGSKFYEADYPSKEGPNSWRFVFLGPPGPRTTTVMLYYNSGSFGKPIFIDQPWLEDVVIPLPIQMGLEQATQLKNQAGYTSPASSITLRWPLYPGVNEPYYIFAVPAQSVYVFVGVYDGTVHTQPLGA